MCLLICNKTHTLTVPPNLRTSNTSELTVLNISNQLLYCLFDEFECEGDVTDTFSFISVPFYPMQTVRLQTGIELCWPYGRKRGLKKELTLYASLKMNFFDRVPLALGRSRPVAGLVPIETELIRCVLHIPAGTPRNFVIKQVCYYSQPSRGRCPASLLALEELASSSDDD
jgi:hypothetical protein